MPKYHAVNKEYKSNHMNFFFGFKVFINLIYFFIVIICAIQYIIIAKYAIIV